MSGPSTRPRRSPPEGWPGWPDGKKFAFVLTHDVEGPDGLAKCRQLMQLEKELGFRSSFNFIPEGEYAVSRELRGELAQNGFEVGVHDLHHDGMLYRSREDFSENARWINHYLKEWGAVGFRSGFMLRNLDWLHELNIQYDASTFDTDPFEPQPDGAGTIFPFWVPAGPAGSSKFDVQRSMLDVDSPSSAIGNRQSAIGNFEAEPPAFRPPSSVLRRSATSSFPTPWCRTPPCFCRCRSRRRKSGCGNWIGSSSAAAWRW